MFVRVVITFQNQRETAMFLQRITVGDEEHKKLVFFQAFLDPIHFKSVYSTDKM